MSFLACITDILRENPCIHNTQNRCDKYTGYKYYLNTPKLYGGGRPFKELYFSIC